VRFIARRDHSFQMFVVRFDDLISRRSVEWHVAWSTELSTSHRLHVNRSLHTKRLITYQYRSFTNGQSCAGESNDERVMQAPRGAGRDD